jgi:acyl-CoA synthetase (AMP-forming)/AMP-acid ligase II
MHTIAVLNYSSGTTGLPKGVEITHLNYISNCLQVEYVTLLGVDSTARVARARGLSVLPMYHAFGQTVHCVCFPRLGTPLYIMQKYNFLDMLQHVQDFRITTISLVPPIIMAMTRRPEVSLYDLSSLETVGCGAAPLSQETLTRIQDLVPGHLIKCRQGWGMTEITCSACGVHPDTVMYDTSVGELNPNMEAKIVDDAGEELNVGKLGEFWIRGPNVMKGYWRMPEATEETKTAEGWLKTGDIARRDENGMIYIIDRKKVRLASAKYERGD